MKMQSKTQKLTTLGLLLALGIILPFATAHGIGVSGGILLPMHIPVFICGFLCGPLFGALCGVILPIINSLITNMPSLYPMMPIMVCELTVYGFVSGLLYCKTSLGKYKIGVYISLLIAMVLGRVAYGLAYQLLLLISKQLTVSTVWIAIATGVPGIVVQLLLVPTVVFAIEGAYLKGRKNIINSAKNLIANGKATCVVIRDGQIINIDSGKGIKPVITLYEQGLFADSTVVDKIIGKATAMILVLGKVKACHGVTVSKNALKYLTEHNVFVTFDTCVDNIINRSGDGICPMEQTVKDIDSPEEALAALKSKLKELSINKNI